MLIRWLRRLFHRRAKCLVQHSSYWAKPGARQ